MKRLLGEQSNDPLDDGAYMTKWTCFLLSVQCDTAFIGVSLSAVTPFTASFTALNMCFKHPPLLH